MQTFQVLLRSPTVINQSGHTAAVLRRTPGWVATHRVAYTDESSPHTNSSAGPKALLRHASAV